MKARRRRVLLPALQIGFLSFGGLLAFHAAAQESSPEKGAFSAESAEESEFEDVTADPAMRKIADRYLTRVQAAFETQDGPAIASLFDFHTLLDIAEKRGLIPAKLKDDDRFVQGFEKGFSQQFAAFAGFLAFDEHRIQRIEKSKNGALIVYCRLWDEEIESFGKMRWWLNRTGDSWKAYDFEDFDANQRFSTMLGLGITIAETKEPWVPGFRKIMVAIQNTGGDLDQALVEMAGLKADMKSMLEHQLPLAVDSTIRAMLVGAYMEEDELDLALEQIDLALQRDPDGILFQYMRGSCLIALEKWDEALIAFNLYGAKLGWDADLYGMTSAAHLGAGRKALAIEHSVKGLKDHQDAWFCLEVFGQAIPDDRKSEIEPHFKRLSAPEEAYDYLMDVFLYEAEDLAAGRALHAIFKKSHPGSELIEIYEEELKELEAEAKAAPGQGGK